jgi:argininosuccinate lyase
MATSANNSDLPVDEFSTTLTKLEEIISSIDPVFKKVTPEQRKAKNAVGIKRRGFVDTAHVIVQKNTDFVPNFFNVGEFNQKMAKMQVLSQVHNEIKKFTEYIRNAEILLGNDVYHDALSIHRYLREAAKSGMSGATPLYKRLKKQFPNGKRTEEIEVQADSTDIK